MLYISLPSNCARMQNQGLINFLRELCEDEKPSKHFINIGRFKTGMVKKTLH